MEIEALLHALGHAELLPRQALKAAAERRAELVPLFLQEIDDFVAAPGGDEARRQRLFFIFHLLGDWRETVAYRPLARFLRCPPEEVGAVLGDGTTETAHRVVAAVFDGDPQPLFDAILDRDADEFVRSGLCETVAMLVLRGELDRDLAARFLRDAFMNIEPQAESFVWNGWQSAIAMLGLSELKPLVKKAFDRRFLNRWWLNFGHFEKDLQKALESPADPDLGAEREDTLFGDTIEELSTWYGWSEKYLEDQQKRQEKADLDRVLAPSYEPHVNPFKGVGRNDPCPCGSGKKFKKCCLAAAA